MTHVPRGLLVLPLSIACAVGCGAEPDEASLTEIGFDSGSIGDDTSDGSSGDGSLTILDGGNNGPPPVNTISVLDTDDFQEFPQYLAMRKSPTEGGDAAEQARCEALLPGLKGLPFYGNTNTCVIFNTGIVNAIKDQTQRRAVLAQGYEEVRVRAGSDSAGGRKLAVEFFLDMMNESADVNETYLRDHLAAAKAAHMPVIIALDAVNWWDKRPDLWNFFDPAKPGYDPKNVDNVEWDNPAGTNPPRIFWRNWGSQIRVDTPIPNFAAPRYRDAIRTLLNRFLPIVREFEVHLPPKDHYLYGGMIVGTELDVGSNHYYYANGNQYIPSPRECDPGQEWKGGACPKPAAGACSAYNHNVCPGPSTATPIGYHAAADMKLGSSINDGVKDAIIRDYVSFINHSIVVENGLPTSKVYSHTAAPSYGVAQVGSMIPGWSMYFGGATDIGTTAGPFIESSETQRMHGWSSPEWLPFGPNDSDPQSAWYGAIENALNYRNNRMISMANWEGIYKNPRAVGAVGQSMSAPRLDACTFSPRMIIGAADINGTTGIRISFSSFNVTTYLAASSKPDTNGVGGLAVVDVANEQLDPLTRSHFFGSDAPQKVYVQLATDGCSRAGAGQRMLSPIVELTITGNGQAPSGTHLFSSTKSGVVTLSWEVPIDTIKAGYEAYLNVSTDPTFAAVDVANEVATGKTMYVRDGYDPNKTYFARLAVDSGGVRSYSNVIEIK